MTGPYEVPPIRWRTRATIAECLGAVAIASFMAGRAFVAAVLQWWRNERA